MLRRLSGLAALFALGCSAPSTKEQTRTPEPPPDPPPAVATPDAAPADAAAPEITFAASAKENYERGTGKLASGEWVEAATYFAHIQQRYPYSRYAVLSELRTCDAQLGAKDYRSAFDGYNLFRKFHPTHDEVASGYVALKTGEAMLRSLQDDDMDSATRLDGLRQLEAYYARFLADYPASPHRDLATQHRDEARSQREQIEALSP